MAGRILMLGGACVAVASVVIIPGGAPKPFTGLPPAIAEDAILRTSAANEFTDNSARVLLSSYSSPAATGPVPGLFPSGESFIRGALQAWGEHLHLVLRPEEVWFTILTQLNFYMNSHAEELRDMFVDHEGQEVIYIEDYTWYLVLSRFRQAIQERVKTDWLMDWITPNFTTTTENDIMTANVLMMGLTKAFFKFEGGIVCGLPSVTLLGKREDWAALLKKLDRLADFGVEPTEYKARLTPILTRFVASFDEPDTAATRDFWNAIASARSVTTCGAPPLYISGWITGFLFWNDAGRPYGRIQPGGGDRLDLLTLDGVTYPMLDITTLPVGYARAPFIMHDFDGQERFPAYVAAGTLGKQIVRGAPEGFADALRRQAGAVGNLSWLDAVETQGTLQPLSAWMLYGPVDHNATDTRWRAETEMVDIARGTKALMNGMTCGRPFVAE